MGIELETGLGKKKKGIKPVFKVLLKRRKTYLAKRVKLPNKRNLNTFTIAMPLKKGVQQAAKVNLKQRKKIGCAAYEECPPRLTP